VPGGAAGRKAGPREQPLPPLLAASEASSEGFGVLCSRICTWRLSSQVEVSGVTGFYRVQGEGKGWGSVLHWSEMQSSRMIFVLLLPGINAHEFIKTKRLLYLQEYEHSLFLTRMQIAACVCVGITTPCVYNLIFWCIKKGQT